MDWIIVLGCPVRWEGGELQGSLGRRVRAAHQLFMARTAAARRASIVVTGGGAWEGERECDAMERALVERGVPKGSILAESCARTTAENARYTASLLRPYRTDTDEVFLVTSHWHIPRASMLFKEAGLPTLATPAPDDHVGASRVVQSVRERVAWAKDRTLVLLRTVSKRGPGVGA